MKLDLYVGFTLLIPTVFNLYPDQFAYWVLTVPHLYVYIRTHQLILSIKQHLRNPPR